MSCFYKDGTAATSLSSESSPPTIRRAPGNCGTATEASSTKKANSHATARRCFASEASPLLPSSVYGSTNKMEKVRDSKVARWADRLRVNAEPGLTNAQLMLANDDLKPVEPARRQWRARNFVSCLPQVPLVIALQRANT